MTLRLFTTTRRFLLTLSPTDVLIALVFAAVLLAWTSEVGL